MTLQVNPYRIGEAEEHAGRRGVKGIVAAKHDRDDGDPAPARAHVLRKDADRAKRELRPGKTGERAGDEHRGYPVADDVDAERARRFRLLAYATQPQSDWRAELNNADQRRERPSGPRYSGLACEGPAEQRNAGKPRNCDSTETDDAGVAEGAADAEYDPQEIRRQSRGE